MLTNFNIKKLDELLYDFYSITGNTVSVWNAEMQQLSYQPKEMYAFCRRIKSTAQGKLACFQSDKELCITCGKTGAPATHTCHAGLVDVAFPIKYRENILGYIMFGQIARKSDEEMQPVICRLAKEYGVDADALAQEYTALNRYNEALIRSAANLLKQSTRYLWLSDYIDIAYDTTTSRIDAYIRAHLSEPISIASLCTALDISKKRLYYIAHRSFGMPIGEYICSLRVAQAKRLLSTTDHSIQEIAVMVGIPDYNYFTKFFKSRVHISPLKYRKGFPFNLHADET